MLVVGGAGGMGSWWRQALAVAGWEVEVADPAVGPTSGTGEALRFASVEEVPDLGRYDFLLVAVPLAATAGALVELVERRPRGVVVEIASIQGHLAPQLERARRAGVRVIALHPMFGPGRPIEGSDPLRFVLAAQDDAAAEEAAVAPLLVGLPAQVATVPFARHDVLMAWVLGLAHLTSLLFGRALAGCGESAADLAAVASTTFARQGDVARGLFAESPDLYLDIQRLNPHRGEVYAAVGGALEEIARLVETGDRDGFRALFAAARDTLENG